MIRQSIVDRIYQDNLDLLKFLEDKNEPSFMVQFNTVFTKTLLLSAASYFEHEICRMVQTFIEYKTQNDECIVSIVKQKAIERQYHTYFDWEGRNANKFFSLFGKTFKENRLKDVKEDTNLDSAIKSFLELGNERNKLVHQNFADCTIEKTAEEVYKLYQQATLFIDFLDR
ncbi:HEPN domain-containing protein, partial [Nostoc sp. 'Peltigera malacea cyanobiont' DB3992]|uniref:HEPN domain-containing protein n=1 Tax=Nostoc sp. 'Peltigera malacea cyanobiont' DB3992 TaxID=1206980 RepID=UPI000C04806E